jgi:hypothetical protein
LKPHTVGWNSACPISKPRCSPASAPTTAYKWLQHGEGTHKRPQTRQFAEFAETIKKAQARRVAHIEQAARGGAIVYERTDPKHWGRRERLDVYRYCEQIERRARQLGDKYDLDITELIERAERYANGLDEDDCER